VLLPLTCGLLWHYWKEGHLAVGLHADAIYQAGMSFGIPGVNGAYSVQIVNLTPLPLFSQACLPPSDTSRRPLLYRYRVEKWNSDSREWRPVAAIDPGDCAPFPVVRRILWPGVPVRGVDWEATAARKGLRKGDRVRFTVFSSFDIPDDGLFQHVASSAAFTIVEESSDPETNYRVAH